MADWNPSAYLSFNTERLQPSIDLVARIPTDTPERIIDIGCGPGNSTNVLASRWPHAAITGIDNSAAMISQAKSDYPDIHWVLGDAAEFTPDTTYDIIFSNAALQWLPDHATVIKKCTAMLNRGGYIAVQLPLFWDMPLGGIIRSVAKNPQWNRFTKDVSGLFTMHDQGYYYEMLSKYFLKTTMWITDYIHIMESYAAIMDMIRSTGMKPYLERIDDGSLRTRFEKEVIIRVKEAYPQQSDGSVLFPFKRLFFIARKI
jgi:trans-aconitate 2-methyltransferase